MQSLGFIETRGYGALVRATDAMHKAAAVEKLDCVKIGSAYMTILAMGDAGAVKSAVAAGVAALEGHKGFAGAHVLPAPHREIVNRFTTGRYDGQGEFGSALGLIEVKGLAGLIVGHDAALKAAQATTRGFFALGSGLVAIVLRGDVSAVRAAVEAGSKAAGDLADVHAVNVIAHPHRALESALIDSRPRDAKSARQAIGIVETRGYTGAFTAADAGLKAAGVVVECWKKIGAGLVSVTFGGGVAAVAAAVDAGAAAAEQVSELTARLVIPRPHKAVFSEM